MGSNKICLYKEVDKKCIGCNLKTSELLDCMLKGVCAVIRSNMVFHVAADANTNKTANTKTICNYEGWGRQQLL